LHQVPGAAWFDWGDCGTRLSNPWPRVSNGDQVSRVAALAMMRGKLVDFTGY